MLLDEISRLIIISILNDLFAELTPETEIFVYCRRLSYILNRIEKAEVDIRSGK